MQRHGGAARRGRRDHRGRAEAGRRVAADLALIAAAQKVEHYEISAYGTSRSLAEQIGRPEVAFLLSKTLAEEEIADNLLTQIAREFMLQPANGNTQVPVPRRSRSKK